MLGISGWWRSGCGRCLHSESWKPVLRETGRGKVWPKFACFFPKGKIPAPSLGQGKVSLHPGLGRGWRQGKELCFTLVQLAAATGGYPLSWGACCLGTSPCSPDEGQSRDTSSKERPWVILQAVWQRLRKQEGVPSPFTKGVPEMGMSAWEAGRRWAQGWKSRAKCTCVFWSCFWSF